MTDKTDSKERDLMQLVDAYADASFTQGLEQKTEDPRPEAARAKLVSALRDALAGRAYLAVSAPEGITRDDTVHGETYFTAADIATANAQGFRDGVASLAASAGSEPVATGSIAHLKLMMEASAWGGELQLSDALANIDDFAAAHPSPPEGAGWRPIASFSEDEADELLAWKPGVGRIIVTWLPDGHPDADEGEGWHEAWSHKRVRGITHACIPPAPPASEAKGA